MLQIKMWQIKMLVWYQNVGMVSKCWYGIKMLQMLQIKMWQIKMLVWYQNVAAVCHACRAL